MTRSEGLAYCAGLFDGEGCVIIRKWLDKRFHDRRHVRYELHIEISQVRIEPLETMLAVCGGRLWFQKRRDKHSLYTGRWWWTTDSGSATTVLQALRPFLRLKGTEADVAIAFQRLKLRHGTGRSFKLGLTQDEIDERERAYMTLQWLKKRHYDPAVQADYAARPRQAHPVLA